MQSKKLPRKRKLSKKEEDWLIELEILLSNPPTKRIGFYTTGDNLEAYDLRFEAEIGRQMDAFDRNLPGARASDFCGAVDNLDAALFTVECKANIHSTAG